MRTTVDINNNFITEVIKKSGAKAEKEVLTTNLN